MQGIRALGNMLLDMFNYSFKSTNIARKRYPNTIFIKNSGCLNTILLCY